MDTRPSRVCRELEYEFKKQFSSPREKRYEILQSNATLSSNATTVTVISQISRIGKNKKNDNFHISRTKLETIRKTIEEQPSPKIPR